jgi:Lytic transglycolase
MKAKTKRRLIHLVHKKKLVKRKTSKKVLRTFLIGLATISMGSLSYAITLNRPNISVSVNDKGGGTLIAAPSLAPQPTPQSASGAPAQVGRASWYAWGLPQPDALTCASRTFPRGTYLQVKDLDNGATMVCLVNDYGPEAWTGRVLDLSRGSFEQIDSLGKGTIPVQLRVAAGPTGFNLPIEKDIFTAVVGYDLCQNSHSPQFCEANRQKSN